MKSVKSLVMDEQIDTDYYFTTFLVIHDCNIQTIKSIIRTMYVSTYDNHHENNIMTLLDNERCYWQKCIIMVAVVVHA